MAKFRQVHTTFWRDPKVMEEMTPEDKYFYLYLLTNKNTTQIGVYQITRKEMAFELGYSTESVNSLLDRFINTHKLIKYNDKTRELAILNWGKYNLNKAGKPVVDCVKKELKEVKDRTLLSELIPHIENQDILNEFLRDVDDTLDDTSTTGGQEKEEEKEEEYIYIVFNHWLLKNIINHKTLNQKMESHIKVRLKEFSVEEVLKAIDNYSTVLNGDNYYWTHKWTLQDFMKPNNIIRFLDGSDPLKVFLSNKNSGTRGKQPNPVNFTDLV